jgi:RNA polymerase sigma-19 factor, ECF subfamily
LGNNASNIELMKKPLSERAWSIAVRYRLELHRYLMRRRGRVQDLDDIKQEVYMRLLRMDQAECVREPLAYLYTVAAHVVADYTIAERQQQHVTADTNALEDWGNDPDKALPDDLAERVSLERQVEQALKELPRLQAQVLVLHYQEGLTLEEIAKRTGLSATSVDKYVTRGKARMRALLWDL